MAGMIREKAGRKRYFELRVYAGKDKVTGRSRYVTRGFNGAGYKTDAAARKAAEAELRKLLGKIEDDRAVATEGTVGHLMTEWMKKVDREREETTAKGYGSIAKAVTASKLGPVQLRNLTAKQLDDFLRDLRREPQTVHNYRSALHNALESAVAWEWIATNPLDRVKAPSRKIKPITKVPTAAQIRALRDLAAGGKNPQLGALIWVAASCGARRGELCALRWRHFDQKAATLTIEQSVAHGRKRLLTKTTKTHAVRVVNIGKSAVKMLNEQRARMEDNNSAALPGDAYIFSNEVDSSLPMKPNSITQAFDRLCERAGIAEVRLHDLRHHFATALLARGVDVGTVADLLGHRDASVTLNIYRHFVPAAGAKAAKVMDDILAA